MVGYSFGSFVGANVGDGGKVGGVGTKVGFPWSQVGSFWHRRVDGAFDLKTHPCLFFYVSVRFEKKFL